MKKLFSILKNREPLEKIFFAGVFFAILFYSYNHFTRLETAYRCVDQKNNKVYLLFYDDLDYHRITGVNQDWVKDGISNHDMMDWLQELKKEKGDEFRYYSKDGSGFIWNQSSFFEITSKKGEKYSVPINDYRTVIFDRKKEIYKIYEYENFRYQTEKFLLTNTSDEGFKITMKIKKELICEEDKDLYKKWVNIKIEDLVK